VRSQPNGRSHDVYIAVAEGEASSGSIAKLDWVCSHYPDWPFAQLDRVASAALRAGSLQCLRWLRAAGMVLQDPGWAYVAASSGHMSSFLFVLEEAGCPWSAQSVRVAAAQAGTPEMLQYVRARDDTIWGVELLSQLLVRAGQYDNLPTAQWLRAEGAQWPVTFLLQSSSVSFEPRCWCLRTMQWAVANGCPWGAWSASYCCEMWLEAHSCDAAGIEAALIWAHTAGCPCSSRLHRFIARCNRDGDPLERICCECMQLKLAEFGSRFSLQRCWADAVAFFEECRHLPRRVRIKLLCILLFLVLSMVYNVQRYTGHTAQLDALS
jgi:hypothetical protein